MLHDLSGMNSHGLGAYGLQRVVRTIDTLARSIDGLVPMRRMTRRSMWREYKLEHYGLLIFA